MRLHAGAIVLLCLALAACAGPGAHDILTDAARAGEVRTQQSQRVYIATTRQPAQRAAQVFGPDRSQQLSFAYADISVPPDRQLGARARPASGRKPDPRIHLVATGVGLYRDARGFEDAVRADLKRSGGRALVFVHGYNNHFDDSVYRLAQLAEDARFTGTAVLFSWASAGRVLDYVYDNNSASAAREELEQTMRMLARNGATRIDLVAHSMGTWIAVEALRQLAIAGDPDLGGRLGDVVLASPDIDIDVFKSQMLRIGKPKRRYFVLVSGDDKALRLSSPIAGQSPRDGEYASARDLADYGVIVVNVSDLEASDRLNHAKFADNPLLVRLLGKQLADPNAFEGSDTDVSDAIGLVARGLGRAVGSAAELVITAPGTILRVAVGG
jgi:esterase/lipase superfamily enzyme